MSMANASFAPGYAPARHDAPATEHEKERERIRKGQCATCGIQTHNLSGVLSKNLVPITNADVRSGRCLHCNPFNMTEGIPTTTSMAGAESKVEAEAAGQEQAFKVSTTIVTPAPPIPWWKRRWVMIVAAIGSIGLVGVAVIFAVGIVLSKKSETSEPTPLDTPPPSPRPFPTPDPYIEQTHPDAQPPSKTPFPTPDLSIEQTHIDTQPPSRRPFPTPDSYVVIRPRADPLKEEDEPVCITMNGQNNSHLYLRNCAWHGANHHQEWRFERNGFIRSHYATVLCIGIVNNRLETQTCSDHEVNQKWSMDEAGRIYLRESPQLCATLGGSVVEHVQISLQPCVATIDVSQQYILIPQ